MTGPTDNSVEDFWCMIWEQRVPTIVMLTRIFEGRVRSCFVFVSPISIESRYPQIFIQNSLLYSTDDK